jgi:phosphoglycerol transferase MdoB-like AlkP superfamily enzyme
VLFDKAQRTLRDESKPFFAFIQTAGNHRPYSIPDDHPGFELVKVDAAVLAENGFDSLAAYNGLRYLDFSLGSFFAKAKESPNFRNTVFVMYGDHGNPSTQQTPWEQLLLTGYHVPFVIYAPGLIKGGRRIDFTASLPDCLPTALSLIGVPYLNTALGRDVLNLGPSDRHFSMIGFNGVLDDEFYFRLDPGGPRLFRYRSDSGAEDVHERFPEKLADMQRMQGALYETSKYLLYHNPARAHAPLALPRPTDRP